MAFAFQRSDSPGRFLWSVFGFVAGASLVFFLDPRRGALRRAKLRDKSFSNMRHAATAVRRRSWDLKNRLNGLYHEQLSRYQHEDISDEILAERVRSQLGRHASHAGLLKVGVENGHVILMGAILQSEVDDLVSRLQQVRGVKSIDSQLEVCGSADELDRYSGRLGAQYKASRPAPSPF